MMKNKKAQEEIVGFAIILILVAVIMLIFLVFSLTKPQKKPVESYEARNFIQSFLQYNTICGDSFNNNLSIKEVIFDCSKNKICSNEKKACAVLNSTMKQIMNDSFRINERTPLKAYELNISSSGRRILSMTKGNKTLDYKIATQEFQRDRKSTRLNSSHTDISRMPSSA